MRILLFDQVRRISHVGMCMMCLALICLACEPPSGSSESKSGKTTATTDPAPKKATPTVSEEDKQACREAVESLLEIAADGKNAKAAPLLIYRGENKDREWKSVCDYTREEDQLLVDKTMAKLQVVRSGLASHNFREFITESEKEGVWHVWVTDMKYEDGSEDVKAFAFLKINDKFALGDID